MAERTDDLREGLRDFCRLCKPHLTFDLGQGKDATEDVIVFFIVVYDQTIRCSQFLQGRHDVANSGRVHISEMHHFDIIVLFDHHIPDYQFAGTDAQRMGHGQRPGPRPAAGGPWSRLR